MLQKNRKWKMRILSMALSVIVALSVMPLDFITVRAENAAGESGEVPDGYEAIYTIEDLYGIRNHLGGKYILMNDIDMSEATKKGGEYDCGTGWKPIGSEDVDFYGVFDGNGHKIIGMHIFGEFIPMDEYDISVGLGLFESISGSVINLGMVNSSIDVTAVEGMNIYAGCIAGNASYKPVVENCYTAGTVLVHIDEGRAYAGGLFGSTRGDLGDWVFMCDNYNACDVECSGSGSTEIFAGGILGAATSRAVLNRCYNVGKIGSSNEGGAICGSGNEGCLIDKCQYLRGTADQGIAGEPDRTTGCIPLTESQMKAQTSFGYDFSDVWEIDTYCSYKYPQLKDNRMVRILSIRLAAFPEKAIYNQGDELDLAGAEIEIHYEDGKVTVPVVPSMLGSYDMNQFGKQSIPIVYGGKETAFDIEVKKVELNHTSINLNVGESIQLQAKLEPEGSTDVIQWKTGDSNVATVENGKVTATGVGETTIAAYTESGIETDCVVTVLLPAKSVSLSQTAVTLNVGENIVLEAKLEPEGSTDTIEWKTGNPVVATVENGKVTAIGAGRTVITAYTENGIETNCTVTVLLPAKAVNLGQTSITLNVGESVSLEAKLEPNGSTDTIQWKTGNPAVVTVANGKVTAIGAGRTIVTAYTESGIVANCIVTVAEKKKTDDTTGELDKTVLPNAKIKTVKNKKGKKIALKLSGAVNCDGYKIQYGLKKNFKGAKTISSKKDTVTIKKLKLKKNYYIRVRVYKEISGKTYYGKWSARKSVKIKK